VYYGTSGSTARQNFDQNDDINDVYGYGPDATRGNSREEEEPYASHERQLRSMQDDARLSGRRGATVFGRKYEDGSRGPSYPKDEYFHDDPHVMDDSDHFFDDGGYMEDLENPHVMEDPHVMDHLDGLLYERDNLRRNLDAVIFENIHLQNRHDANGVSKSMNEDQDQQYRDTDTMPQLQTIGMEQDQSTRGVVNEVMAELKNMQQTLLALQTGQRKENEGENSINPVVTTNKNVPTIESVLTNLENMQKTLEAKGAEQDQCNTLETEKYGINSSTAETLQPVQINGDHVSSPVQINGDHANLPVQINGDHTNSPVKINGEHANSPVQINGDHANALDMQQRQNFEVNVNRPSEERISSRVGSIRVDDAARILSGEYVIVINAELKRKSEIEGTVDQGGQEIEGGNDSSEGGTPPFCGETFGSRYL